MIEVRYSRIKFALMLLAFVGGGLLGQAMTHAHRGRAVFAGYLIMALATWGLPYALRYLVANRVLTMDHRGLTVHGFLGPKSFAWRDLEDVSVWTMASGSSSASHLYLHVPYGLFGKFRISEKLLAAPYASIAAVCDALQEARERQPRFPRSTAAVAEPAPAPVHRAAGFGRKGLG